MPFQRHVREQKETGATAPRGQFRADPTVSRHASATFKSEIFMESDPMLANVICDTPRIAAHEDEPFRFR